MSGNKYGFKAFKIVPLNIGQIIQIDIAEHTDKRDNERESVKHDKAEQRNTGNKQSKVMLFSPFFLFILQGFSCFFNRIHGLPPQNTQSHTLQAVIGRILFFIPYICSTVAVSLMWRWILDYEGGILNSILGTNIEWLRDTNTITWCIIIATIWQAPGYGIVMYKAAFSNINDALYEAAELDGANAWQKFRNVTLPGISPTTFFLLQAGVMAGLLTYDLAVLIIPDAWGSVGGVESMGLTLLRLVYYLINNSTTSDANGISYMVSCACVISWLLFVVTGVISVILFNRREKSVK